MDQDIDRDRWWRHAKGPYAAWVAVIVLATAGIDGLTWFHAVALGVMVSTVAYAVVMDRHDAVLTNRMQGAGALEWDVWVNDVLVGRVSDAQYAIMQRAVLRDWRAALQLLMNLVRITIAALGQVVVVIPGMAFWLALGVALLAPQSFVELAQAMGSADADQIRQGVTSLTRMLVALAVTATVLVSACMGRFASVANPYRDEVARLLRQHCETPADGVVTLRVPVQGHCNLSATA